MLKRRFHLSIAMLAVAFTVATADAVTFSQVELGDVTTTGFSISWETSESSLPGLEIFSDAAGTQSLTGLVAIEFFPLTSDQRAVVSSVTIRHDGRTLRDAIKDKNLVLVKVTGLAPDTDYYARPTAVDSMGATIDSGDLQAVTTSRTVDFVAESRQVEIDLTALFIPGTPVAGSILTVRTPAARYPLFAVVGDSWSSNRAVVDLTLFLNASGDRNLLPSGVMPLTITWKGLQETPGSFAGPELNYDGSLLVAGVTRLAFGVTETDVDFIITFMKVPAVVGLPQNIALEAQGPGATTLLDYDRPALIGTTGSLAKGAGPTASLVDGLLAAHTIVFETPGLVDLLVRDPFGPAQSTASIEVLPLTYDNWREYYFGNTTDPAGDPDANPDRDELTNRGEFTTLRNPLVVSSSPIGVRSAPGGITVSLDFNRFQSEYRVKFQTSLDLQVWRNSAITPSLQESLADRDVIQAFFPPTEFNNQRFGAVRAVFDLIPVGTVKIMGVGFDGNTFNIDFAGDEGVTDWKVMGSDDLVTFPYDRTAQSVITEPSPGIYRAEIDLTGSPSAYFMRIER